MSQNWPTVGELITFHYHNLEDARAAIAALPPDDQDRRLFLAGPWESYQCWVRAANVERARLIAGAAMTNYEELLLEIREDATEDDLTLFETARERSEYGGDTGDLATRLLKALANVLTLDHSADPYPYPSAEELPAVRAEITELREKLAGRLALGAVLALRADPRTKQRYLDRLSKSEARVTLHGLESLRRNRGEAVA